MQLRRLTALACVAIVGIGAATLFGWHGLEHSWLYMLIASGLLCIGLYFAVCGIDKTEAREHWRIIAIAITLGVLLKYCIIAGCMLAITRDWRFAVLAMAVTQIDPLSVAAMSGNGRLSSRTQTVLNAWAATDDPMTTILTPVAVAIAAYVSHGQATTAKTSWQALLVNLLPFAAVLVLVGLVAWRQKFGFTIASSLRKAHNHEATKNTAAVMSLVIGAPTRLFSLPAWVGWVYRPAWTANEKLVSRILSTTLYSATFLLGILLAGSHNFGSGILLGVVTFCSQGVATWFVLGTAARFGGAPSAFSLQDKCQLALGQQNGITAILLALVLEPSTPNAVATIGSAIVTINVLNLTCNWAFDRYISHRL
jgi:hypothetical protein